MTPMLLKTLAALWLSAAPVVTGFTLATPNGLNVKAATLTASDTSGAVTGYGVTTSSTAPLASEDAAAYATRVGGGATFTGWTGSAPTTWTAPTVGVYSLRAWAKDAANHVSAAAPAQVVAVGDAIIDDFNRANGTAADATHLWVLAPGYTRAITIASNKVVGTGGYASSYWDQALGAGAYAWSVVQSSGDVVKLRVKPSDSSATFYGFQNSSSPSKRVEIVRYANGTGGSVAYLDIGASPYFTYVAVQVADNGNGTVTVKGFAKMNLGDAWVEKVSYTDSTPLTGDRPGIGVNQSGTGYVDDFHAGNGTLP